MSREEWPVSRIRTSSEIPAFTNCVGDMERVAAEFRVPLAVDGLKINLRTFDSSFAWFRKSVLSALRLVRKRRAKETGLVRLGDVQQMAEV